MTIVEDIAPKAYDFGLDIDFITSGDKHTAMIAQGKLYMTGDNTDGRLGISKRSMKSSTVPVMVQAFSKYRVVKVSCGLRHSAAIIDHGDLYTWGCGSEGQLGLGNSLSQHAPQLVQISQNPNQKSSACVDVSCGSEHTGVVLGNGEIYLFGRGDSGQLGLGDRSSQFQPAKANINQEFAVKISCGFSHTLVLTSNSTIYSFGANDQGQLGVGNKKTKIGPCLTQTPANLQILDIEAGYHSAALTYNGEVYIWGTCDLGQFLVPTRIGEEVDDMIVDVKMGNGYTILIDVQGKLWAFGNNDKGCLGVGDRIIHRGIIEVKGLKSSRIKKLACGNGFVIATGGRIEDQVFTLRNNNDNDKSYLSIMKVPLDEYVDGKKLDGSTLEIPEYELSPKSQSPIKNGILNRDSPSKGQDPRSPRALGKLNTNNILEIPKEIISARERPGPSAESKLNLSNYTKSKAGKFPSNLRNASEVNNSSLVFSASRVLTNFTPRGYTPNRDEGIRKLYSPSSKSHFSASRIEHIAITDISVTSNQNFLQLLSPSSSTGRNESVKRSSNASNLKKQSGSKNDSYVDTAPNDPFPDIPVLALQPNIHIQDQGASVDKSKSFARFQTFGKPGNGKETPLFPISHGNSNLPTPRNQSEVPLVFLTPNNHNDDPFNLSHSNIDPLYSRNPSYISKSNSMSLFLSPNRSSISHFRNTSDIYSNSPRGSASRGIKRMLETEKYIMEITDTVQSSMLKKKGSLNQRDSYRNRNDQNSSPVAVVYGSPKYPSDHSLNFDEVQGSGEKLKTSPNRQLKSPRDFQSPKSIKSEDGLHQWEVSSIKDSPTHQFSSIKQLSTKNIIKQGDQGNFESNTDPFTRPSFGIKSSLGQTPSLEISMDGRGNSHPMKIFDQLGHKVPKPRSSSSNLFEDRNTAAFNSPKVHSPVNNNIQNIFQFNPAPNSAERPDSKVISEDSSPRHSKGISQNVNVLAGFEEMKPSEKYFTKSIRTSHSPPQRDSKGSRKGEDVIVIQEEGVETEKKSRPFGSLAKVEEEPFGSPYFAKRQIAANVAPIKIDTHIKMHSRSPSNDFSFESSPIFKATNKSSPIETRKPTFKSLKELPNAAEIKKQIEELKGQNDILRKNIALKLKKLSDLEGKYKALLNSKKPLGSPHDSEEVKEALGGLEEKNKKHKFLSKKANVEKEKLELLERENKKLKDQGCEGVDAEKLIRENAALGELVRYIYELRALDMEKNVHKDTKAMVESRVNNLMKRLKIDNLGQIQKEVTPRGNNNAVNTSVTVNDDGLDNPFQLAPLQGVPVVETLTEGDGKGKLKLTFIKTLPNQKGSDTKRTNEKDPDTISSKSRDRSFTQLNKSYSRNNQWSANRGDLSDLSLDSPAAKSSNSPFESRDPTPKRGAGDKKILEKEDNSKSSNYKISVSSADKKSFSSLSDMSKPEVSNTKQDQNAADSKKLLSPQSKMPSKGSEALKPNSSEKALTPGKDVKADSTKNVNLSKSNTTSTIKAENSPAVDRLKSPFSKLQSSSSNKKK